MKTFKETIRDWEHTWNNGQCIATSTELPYGFATIHSIRGADHLAFGLFEAKRNGRKINFDAGGAMIRSFDHEGNLISWTVVRGSREDLAEFGFDATEQRQAFQSWQDSQ